MMYKDASHAESRWYWSAFLSFRESYSHIIEMNLAIKHIIKNLEVERIDQTHLAVHVERFYYVSRSDQKALQHLSSHLLPPLP